MAWVCPAVGFSRKMQLGSRIPVSHERIIFRIIIAGGFLIKNLIKYEKFRQKEVILRSDWKVNKREIISAAYLELL